MVFYFRADGTPIAVNPSQINQGSVSADKIYFLCPASSQNAVSVAFSLPNGDSTRKYAMSSTTLGDSAEIVDVDGVAINAWVIKLPECVTENCGQVMVQFYLTDSTGAIKATQGAYFVVEKGVKPTAISETSDCDDFLECIAKLNLFVNNFERAFLRSENATAMEGQLVVGEYNAPNEDALFQVGVGSSQAPQTLFQVGKNGAQYYKMPEIGAELTNKAYVDTAIASIPVVERTFLDASQTTCYLTYMDNKEIYVQHEIATLYFSMARGSAVGNKFYCTFKSGSTPTQVLTGISLYELSTSFTPLANHIVELWGVWNGTKWYIIHNQRPY